MEPETNAAVSGVSNNPAWSRAAKGSGCSRILLFLILCSLMILPVLVYLFPRTFGSVKRGVLEIIAATKEQPATITKTVEKIVEVEVEKIVEVPGPPPPLPSEYVARRTIDTAELYNGLLLRSVLDTQEGRSASVEREDPSGYEIELQLRIKVPVASQSLDELSRLNPELPKLLPELPLLLENSKVSGFYHELYRLKEERIQHYLTRLDRVLSRHNYFDCETILEMEHPETGKRVLLMQGEMDVVSDGTDGDRIPVLDEYVSNSANFQPWTSYGWPKTTKQPNPLLPRYQDGLKEAEEEYAVKGLSAERNQQLRDRIDELKREIADLKARSFLIAEKDPFVVIPLFMLKYANVNPFAPKIGDYAVVIHKDKLYPAIAGDVGPSFQVGEASLRFAKELNEKAGVYSRPASDLKVTYLFFPGSAEEKKGPPDLDRWHERCSELLEGIGGVGEGAELHRWKDLFKKGPDPIPAAADAVSTSPAPEAPGEVSIPAATGSQ